MQRNFNNRGNILVGIIITIVVVSLFGGGLYFYLKKQIPEKPEAIQESEEFATLQTEEPTAEESAKSGAGTEKPEMEKHEPEEVEEEDNEGQENSQIETETPSWEDIYSESLLSPEAKEFLTKVFQKTGKYPTKDSTNEEKQFYLEECNNIFENILKKEGCYGNIASFTEDESICEEIKYGDREYCIFDVAVIKKDPTICDKIGEKGILTTEVCRQWFESQ